MERIEAHGLTTRLAARRFVLDRTSGVEGIFSGIRVKLDTTGRFINHATSSRELARLEPHAGGWRVVLADFHDRPFARTLTGAQDLALQALDARLLGE